MAAHWYAVQCKGGESFRAEDHLKAQGFEVFHPTWTVEKRYRGQLREIKEPLFPFYLFIQLDEHRDNWAPIRSTRGVLQLVRFGTYPLKVDADLIEALKQRSEKAQHHKLKTGDKVLITRGPFKDLEAIFQTRKGEDRVIILLNLLQHQQRLSISRKDLQRS
ncbi:transcription/translation regulatory transformer protein RfaH [Terasakiispira papahanaumokuakeensis]|nr:transcription/translation regulatory transformer protein RfaH [Terasakiispira papahanaumokuakeensis]